MLAAVVLLSATTLSASPIFGSFDFGGSLTVATGPPQTIDWTSLASVPNKAGIGSASGSFAGLAGTTISIQNLSNPPEVVDGAGFANTLFIAFDADPTLPDLLINFIPLGFSTPAQCGLAAAAGQSCTLAGSPFTFTNVTAHSSTATFSFSGVTSDGLSTWTGTFTSQFNTMSYQQVLAALGSVGHVTNTYSAQITATPNPTIPEPNTVLMVLGAFGVFVGCLRKKRITS